VRSVIGLQAVGIYHWGAICEASERCQSGSGGACVGRLVLSITVRRWDDSTQSLGAGYFSVRFVSFPLYEDLYDSLEAKGRSVSGIFCFLSFLRELFSLYITRLLFEGSELS
jgi:hypothetical protein